MAPAVQVNRSFMVTGPESTRAPESDSVLLNVKAPCEVIPPPSIETVPLQVEAAEVVRLPVISRGASLDRRRIVKYPFSTMRLGTSMKTSSPAAGTVPLSQFRPSLQFVPSPPPSAPIQLTIASKQRASRGSTRSGSRIGRPPRPRDFRWLRRRAPGLGTRLWTRDMVSLLLIEGPGPEDGPCGFARPSPSDSFGAGRPAAVNGRSRGDQERGCPAATSVPNSENRRP